MRTHTEVKFVLSLAYHKNKMMFGPGQHLYEFYNIPLSDGTFFTLYRRKETFLEHVRMFRLCNNRKHLVPSLVADLIVEYILSPGNPPPQEKEQNIAEQKQQKIALKSKNQKEKRLEKKMIKNFYRPPPPSRRIFNKK